MEKMREKAEKIANCIEVVYFITMIICVFIAGFVVNLDIGMIILGVFSIFGILSEYLCKSFGYKYLEDFVYAQLCKKISKKEVGVMKKILRVLNKIVPIWYVLIIVSLLTIGTFLKVDLTIAWILFIFVYGIITSAYGLDAFVRMVIKSKEEKYGLLEETTNDTTFYYDSFSKVGYIHLQKIAMNGHMIDLTTSTLTVKMLRLLIEVEKDLPQSDASIEGNSQEKQNIMKLQLSDVKDELLFMLRKLNQYTEVKDYYLQIKCPFYVVSVKSDVYPNKHLKFLSASNDETLLNRVKKIGKENLINAMKSGKDDTILPFLADGDYVMHTFLQTNKWKPLNFTNTKEEENSSIQFEDIPNTRLGNLIRDIDGQIDLGYVFGNISMDRWLNGYRKECLSMMVSKYKMSEDQEIRLVHVLTTLLDNMYDAKEKEYNENTDIGITALEELLKYDGLIDSFKIEK